MTFRLTLLLTALTLTASLSYAQRQFGFDNRKASGQPYLKPEETVAKLKLLPEFEASLFAAEPDVVNPIAFTVDEKGRLWVIECYEYPRKAGKKVPRDRIVILEDTNGDGVCDKRTIFAEGKDFPVTDERRKAGLGAFDLASGIEVGYGGVFVGAPPYLWFIENQNDKPGRFQVLLKGFGSQDTHETLNTFQWGPDGWLYGLHGIFTQSEVTTPDGENPIRMNAAVWRYHPQRRSFEIFSEGTSNPWGMDWRNSDGQFILCCCVIPHLYHMVPGGIYRRQAGATLYPYAYSYLQEICDHTFHKESGWAHAGLLSLDVPHMPEKYRQSVIFGSIHGCMLKQNILKPNGSSFIASRGDNFLESGDKNSRFINLRWGPAGEIYVIDWHDQNPCHQAAPDSWDYDHGRIYRIQVKGAARQQAEDLGRLQPKELLEAVRSENPYRWRTALRLLYELPQDRKPRGEMLKSKVVDLLPEARKAWVAYALEGMQAEQVASFRADLPGIKNASPELLGWTIRFIAESGYVTDETIKAFTQIAVQTLSPVVRRELASAAVRLASLLDVSPLLHALLVNHPKDVDDPVLPQLVWLAYEKSLTRDVPSELAWLKVHAAASDFVKDVILPRAMRRLAATGQAETLEHVLRFLEASDNMIVRQRVLEGLTTELAGRTIAAPKNWPRLREILEKESQLASLVSKLAVSFRDPVATERALAVAIDPNRTTLERLEAIRQLGLLKPENADTQVLIRLLRADSDLAVRQEAARAISSFDNPALPSLLLTDWAKHPALVQGEIINTLASRKDWAKALLKALMEKQIDRSAISDNTVLRIQAFKDPDLNSLIEKSWGRIRTTPAELQALIDKTRASLDEGNASFSRGKAVFDNHCAKCHRFEGRGSEVGPPLDGAARDIEYILVNVLDPNRVIGAPYFLRIARTLDGRVEQGVLAEEDEKTITLKIENGVLKKIPKEDLDGPIQTVEKSLMPEGLTSGMKAEEFRDLIRYLMAHPFITQAKVNGNQVRIGVTGRFTLPGTGPQSVIEAEFTSLQDWRTQLLIGINADYEIQIDGQTVAAATAPGRVAVPDQAAYPVTLSKGRHSLTITVKDKGTGANLYVRFLDPNRVLKYDE